MNKPKILIAEDESAIVESLVIELEPLGAEVVTTSNGEEALNKFNEMKFDAILSDINMPKMTGIKLLRKLREGGMETPFVILSAYRDSDNIIEALKLGAYDFLEKPWEENQLLDVMGRALELGREMNRWSKDDEFIKNLKQAREENSNQTLAYLQKNMPFPGRAAPKKEK